MNAKLDKQVVLYFPKEEIGTQEGSHCGACMMFVRDHCTVVKGTVKAKTGVCGLYVHGEHMGPDMRGMMPKNVAGYIDGTDSDGLGGKGGNAPTHCENCRFYMGGENSTGDCQKVEGPVEALGCCNAWMPKSSDEMSTEDWLEARNTELYG